MKQNPCILTLDPSIGIITNRQDIVAYIVRQFFGTPGRISDTYLTEIISFREIKSKYSTELQSICVQSQDALETTIRRMIPSEKITVECSLDKVKNDNRYNMVIRIVIEDVSGLRKPVLTTANVEVVDDVFTIKLQGDSE